MKKTPITQRFALMLALVAGLSTLGMAQHNEVHYQVDKKYKSGPIPAAEFTTSSSGTYAWTATAGSFFSCTGCRYDTFLPWRLLFAHLVDPANNWTTSASFSVSLTANSKITSLEHYYTQTGDEVFVPGVGTSMDSRHINSLVVDYITWIYGDYETQDDQPPVGP